MFAAALTHVGHLLQVGPSALLPVSENVTDAPGGLDLLERVG